ncbi:MAG: hypothetical protein EZS28_019765 [Streblomastix strix]|uniref:Uncharacterized protein n=1 Tax=Streblomastix strix TaxID=222440 RepID=A0A5J4VQE4_9EUKA|nr:MAG: hypothetical protein EZS28_019765 [Streblomastix strix]
MYLWLQEEKEKQLEVAYRKANEASKRAIDTEAKIDLLVYAILFVKNLLSSQKKEKKVTSSMNLEQSDLSGRLEIRMSQGMHVNTNGDDIQTKDDELFLVLKESDDGLKQTARQIEF